MAIKYCPQCQQTYAAAERLCPNDQTLLSLRDPYHLVGRTLLDKYRIEALVGLGGMGAVYCAHHLGLDRRVAFKILQPNITVNDQRIAELFEREAKVAARLSHENIVDVKDAGRSSDGLAYIVMEWLDGRTLEEELRETGRFSFARVALALRQIAAALEEAHSKHVVHRDLKPANVMLVKRDDGREQIKVLDFGIGKVIGETGSLVSAVMGTPSYASPEQLQLGGQIDARADVYSLGVILYQMLSGRLPFKGTSLSELIQLQLTATPPPLGELRPDTPVAIEHLIHQMLAKNAADRPQSARAVATAFDRALVEAETAGLETRPFVDSLSSAETTIERGREMSGQATESLPKPAPSPPLAEDAPATRPFTRVAAAPRASRARWLLIPALIGLTAIAGGYGVYRYAFDAEPRAGEPGTIQISDTASAREVAPSPTPETAGQSEANSAPSLNPARQSDATPQAKTSPSPGAQVFISKPQIKTGSGGAVVTDGSVKPSSPTAPAAPRQDQTQNSAAARTMADQHFLRARQLYNQREYRAALGECNEALRLNPRHLGALNLRRKIRRLTRILDER